MTKERKQYLLIALIVATVIIIDQIIKIWVKTHMQIGQSIPVFGSWFQILFVENEGMAFGMSFGGSVGKLLLSLFRISASAFLLWYLVSQIRKGESSIGLIVSMSLIAAGAIGNLIDSAFYGLIFNDSYYHVAQMFPPEGGYESFLHGRVVDMFYFPLIDTTLPDWLPIWGGNHFLFFNAVFNFADAAITVGVVWMMISAYVSYKKDSESAEEKIN